jgi:hypothetical protein
LIPPAIRPGYLTTDHDRQVLLEGLRIERRIAAQPALASVIAAERQPGPASQSDDDLLEYAIRIGKTLYYPVGTCRMGRDESAVVDDSLRVHGIAGLRVIDASVMPTLVSENTNAPNHHDRRAGVRSDPRPVRHWNSGPQRPAAIPTRKLKITLDPRDPIHIDPRDSTEDRPRSAGITSKTQAARSGLS